MELDQTENFIRGEVSSSIGSSDTTISVTNASNFPDPSTKQYNLVLWDPTVGRPDEYGDTEIVRITGRDTTNDNLTVERGQEGTTAASHSSSSELQLTPTAKMFSDMQEAIDLNTVRNELSEDYTIPAKEQYIVHDDWTIDASANIDIEGEAVIIK